MIEKKSQHNEKVSPGTLLPLLWPGFFLFSNEVAKMVMSIISTVYLLLIAIITGYGFFLL